VSIGWSFNCVSYVSIAFIALRTLRWMEKSRLMEQQTYYNHRFQSRSTVKLGRLSSPRRGSVAPCVPHRHAGMHNVCSATCVQTSRSDSELGEASVDLCRRQRQDDAAWHPWRNAVAHVIVRINRQHHL